MTGLSSFQFLLSNASVVTFHAASEDLALEYAISWAHGRGLTVTADGVEIGTAVKALHAYTTETNR